MSERYANLGITRLFIGFLHTRLFHSREFVAVFDSFGLILHVGKAGVQGLVSCLFVETRGYHQHKRCHGRNRAKAMESVPRLLKSTPQVR